MPFYILLILGGLSAFGPLAIDMYLPAFPAIGAALAADPEQVQLSLPRLWNGCLPRVSLRRWVAVRAWWSTGQWCAICVRQLMQPRRFPS